MSESSELNSSIIQYLTYRGYFVWRENSGAYLAHGRMIRYGYPGIPDIIGMSPVGQFIGIETKIDDKISDSQLLFHQAVRGHGGLIVVPRSLEEVKDKLGI